jgi:hypothetical protein
LLEQQIAPIQPFVLAEQPLTHGSTRKGAISANHASNRALALPPESPPSQTLTRNFLGYEPPVFGIGPSVHLVLARYALSLIAELPHEDGSVGFYCRRGPF